MKNVTINGNLPTILPVGFLKDRVNVIREEGLPCGYYTGISNLDDVFRLDKGRLITITGVPNCGKSEFVDFYTSVLNKLYGLKTLFFSPENQPYELHISKLVAKYTNKPLAELTQAEIDVAIDYICKNFYFINYDKVKSFNDIENVVETTISTLPFDILVIDSFNKVEYDKPAHITDTDFIGKILNKLCEMAIKYNIMVILVAHPTKMEWNSGDKAAKCPTAYNINGSANYFNMSDYVLGVHRDRNVEDETVTIRVDKVRFSHYGTQGKCLLKYDVASGNYYNAPGEFDFDEEASYTPIEFTMPPLPEKKEPLDVTVSLYSGKKDTAGSDVCLKDFILTDKYRNIVEQIRAGATPEDRHNIKAKMEEYIPSATILGRFSQRDSEHLVEYSGLTCIDIDLKDNVDIMPQVPSILRKLEYVAYCGKSISGDGYFAIIPIENPKHFKQHFYALEEEMKSYGIVIDKSCKDIARMRYASYDADGYYNPNARTYYWELDKEAEVVKESKKEKAKCKRKKTTPTSSSMTDAEMVGKQLELLKSSSTTIPDDYDTWFKVGMALNSGLGEDGRTFFHEFSKLSDKYDEDECNTQYDNIISHYDGDSDITLGTLFHIIDEAVNDKAA